jgi:mannose-6-phosphate isomerase-like protein (cupin superfamily)
MDQGHELGWRQYSFEEMQMRDIISHGGDIQVHAATPIKRGPGELHISLVELPPHAEGYAIGLHVHRDLPTGKDVEEIFAILEGHGIMTFTNGDTVALSPGDVVTTYPGTGHALRVTGDIRMRLVAVLPHDYRTAASSVPASRFPDRFSPRIQVTSCHSRTMAPLEALCNSCSATWKADSGDEGAINLPQWATAHPCIEQE